MKTILTAFSLEKRSLAVPSPAVDTMATAFALEERSLAVPEETSDALAQAFASGVAGFDGVSPQLHEEAAIRRIKVQGR